MTQFLPLAVIAGAGPGLGQTLIKRFETGGYKVVGFSRTQPKSNPSNLDIRAVDLTDPQQTETAIQALINECGVPKIVIHNTAHLVIKSLDKTTTSDFEDCWRAMALSAFNLAQSVMVAVPLLFRAQPLVCVVVQSFLPLPLQNLPLEALRNL
jgi:NAD(P)-dependent dehydrogenase (short-subunit alcohol dehydrogenase family)